MKTKKKSLFAMLVAIVMLLGTMEHFVNNREAPNIQKLAWGHTWAAQHSKGIDFGVNAFLSTSYAGIAGTAITTGFACGVVTPAALVCYGGAAMVGL